MRAQHRESRGLDFHGGEVVVVHSEAVVEKNHAYRPGRVRARDRGGLGFDLGLKKGRGVRLTAKGADVLTYHADARGRDLCFFDPDVQDQL